MRIMERVLVVMGTKVKTSNQPFFFVMGGTLGGIAEFVEVDPPCDENVSRVNLSFHWDDDLYDNVGAAVSFMTLFVIGVPLNSYIIAVLIYKKLYHQPTFLLLLNLTVTELLLCLIPLLFNTMASVNKQGSFGSTDYVRCNACKIGVAFVIFSASIVYTVMLLSVDRLIFFKTPLQYSNFVTVKKTLIALVVEWVVSIFQAAPTLFGYGDLLFSVVCGHIFSSQYHIRRGLVYALVTGMFSSSAGVVIVVCNIWMIILALRVYNKKRKLKVGVEAIPVSDCKDETGLKRRVPTVRRKQQFRWSMEIARKQCAFARTFGAILVTNCFSLLPFVILGVMIYIVALPIDFAIFVQVTVYAQTTTNPIVQVLFAPELRKLLFQCAGLKNSKLGKCIAANCAENCCGGEFMMRELATKLTNKVPATLSSPRVTTVSEDNLRVSQLF